MLGWYLLANQIIASTGFTAILPVGDFSGYWEKKAVKDVEAKPELHEE